MRAITLWQPWASLVAFEEKKVETRCWSTKYRGELAIHSAARTPASLGVSRYDEKFVAALNEISKKHNWREYALIDDVPLGCVLCIVKLVSIELTATVRGDLSEQERLFGNYEDGRYAWFFEMVQKFDVPIPAKGNRMLWNWEWP